MSRTHAILLCGSLLSCKGHKDEGSQSSEDEPFVPLETASGEFDVHGDISQDTCDDDLGDEIEDALRGFSLKFDQIATGLSIFFDPDIGWIPCEGSVDSFRCVWGNAPSETPAGSWDWSLVGTTTEGEIDAKLTLKITCNMATNDCEACTVVQEVTGSLD